MLLAINANNTNTVFAVYDGATLRGAWRCATDPRRTADEYVVWLTQLMSFETLGRQNIDAAILSSVVPATVFNLKTLCRRYFNCDPLIVGEGDAAIDHQPLPSIAVEGEVHADLAGAAERQEDQLVGPVALALVQVRHESVLRL